MEPTPVDARAPSWLTWPASAGGLAGYFVVRTEDWLLVKYARACQLIRDNPPVGWSDRVLAHRRPRLLERLHGPRGPLCRRRFAAPDRQPGGECGRPDRTRRRPAAALAGAVRGRCLGIIAPPRRRRPAPHLFPSLPAARPSAETLKPMHAKGTISPLLVVGVVAFSLGVVLTTLSVVGVAPDLSGRAGPFWNWLTRGESGSATLRNVGLLLLTLIGLPFAMWRTIVAARQADVAERALRNERVPNGRRDGGPRLPSGASRRH